MVAHRAGVPEQDPAVVVEPGARPRVVVVDLDDLDHRPAGTGRRGAGARRGRASDDRGQDHRDRDHEHDADERRDRVVGPCRVHADGFDGSVLNFLKRSRRPAPFSPPPRDRQGELHAHPPPPHRARARRARGRPGRRVRGDDARRDHRPERGGRGRHDLRSELASRRSWSTRPSPRRARPSRRPSRPSRAGRSASARPARTAPRSSSRGSRRSRTGGTGPCTRRRGSTSRPSAGPSTATGSGRSSDRTSRPSSITLTFPDGHQERFDGQTGLPAVTHRA